MNGYRYSPRAWAVAAERSQARSERRRRRLRRHQLALCTTWAALALGAAVLVLWLSSVDTTFTSCYY